ncbi:MAG: cupin domain-containing protein [Proteobacteria bacterium]|nr:MAG: cupin domain-containing protein [Pseudomonadota bacterium]QKK10774.1 MAG: cupin domain-containing protein [Pseudomonadota bacterium]
MSVSIGQWREEDEYFIEEGCFILELANSAEDPQLSIARARVIPGVATRWHRLRDTAERYLILEGTGSVEVGEDSPRNVSPGDVVLIPPMMRQRITNTGDIDLVFLALCTPRFLPENYESVTAAW